MKRKFIASKEFSERPARPDGTCFYCGVPVGEEHKEDCVIRSRTIVMEFRVPLCIEVPEFWDEYEINFHFNDSSYCIGNIIKDIEFADKHRGCLCFTADGRFLREASAKDEELLGYRTEDGRASEVVPGSEHE